MNGGVIVSAVFGVLGRIDRVLQQETGTGVRRWHEAIARSHTGRIICEGCGCLCWPDEQCPGCRARRLAPEVA